MINIAKLTT